MGKIHWEKFLNNSVIVSQGLLLLGVQCSQILKRTISQNEIKSVWLEPNRNQIGSVQFTIDNSGIEANILSPYFLMLVVLAVAAG